MGQTDPERLETLRAALELLSDEDTAIRAELLAILAVELSWSADWEERHAIAEKSVAMARRVGEPATLVRVIARAFHAVFVPHTHELRGQWAKEALDVTAELLDPDLRGLALDRAMQWCLDAGDVNRLDELLAEQLLLVDRLGEPVLRFDAMLLRAIRTLVTAPLDESQLTVDELLRVGTEFGRVNEVTATWGTLAAVLAMRRGEHADMIPLIEAATRDYPELPVVNAALAQLYCELGQSEEAHSLLDAAAAAGFASLPRDRTWISAIGGWADTAATLHANEAALTLYDELCSFADQVISPVMGPSEGPVGYHLGLLASALGRYEEAEAHFVQSENTCRRLGATFWLARNHIAYAEMLQVRASNDDLDHALRLVDESLSASRAEGYGHLERRATDLLSAII